MTVIMTRGERVKVHCRKKKFAVENRKMTKILLKKLIRRRLLKKLSLTRKSSLWWEFFENFLGVILRTLLVLVAGRSALLLAVLQGEGSLVLLAHAVQQEHDESHREQEPDASSDDGRC